MDVRKVTVSVIRDFPDTNYIFIPVRKRRSNEKANVDSFSQCKLSNIQQRTGSVTTRSSSMNKYIGLNRTINRKGKEWNDVHQRKIQIIVKNKPKQTITDLKTSRHGKTVNKITSGVSNTKTGRKTVATIDKQQYIVEVLVQASNAAIDTRFAPCGIYCRKKSEVSCSRVNDEEIGLQCILIGRNSKSIRTVKLTRRSDGVLICPEIMNNRFKCTNYLKDVALETDFEKSHLECVTTNDEVESEKNLCLTENARSGMNDVKDSDSGIDSEEAELQSHISDYDVVWSLRQSALGHQNNAVAEKYRRIIECDVTGKKTLNIFGSKDEALVDICDSHEEICKVDETLRSRESREDVSKECEVAIDEMISIVELEEQVCGDVGQVQSENYEKDITRSSCKNTLEKVKTTSELKNFADIDDFQKDDCYVKRPTNELLPRQLFLNETDEDLMIACSKTLNRIIKTLELFVEFEDDDNVYDTVESPGGLSRNKNTKSVPPVLSDEGKRSEAVAHQSIDNESGRDAKSNDDLNSLTILTRRSHSATAVDPENQDNNLQKSSTIPAILPVDLRRDLHRELIDCNPDKPLDNSPVDLTCKNTTVGNNPPINPTIDVVSKQSFNPIYEPISPPVVRRPIYEPISPPVVKRPIYEPISPPVSPITISNTAASPFAHPPAKTTLPATCNLLGMRRSYDLVPPQPTQEELRKKAEKEFLKELWQEGSGRIVRAECDDKEIDHKNSRIEENLTKNQSGRAVTEQLPPLGNNFPPYRPMSRDVMTPSNRGNTSVKDSPMLCSLLRQNTNIDKASVLNSALQEKRDHTHQPYPNQQKGLHGEVAQSYNPSQQQGTISTAKSSGIYHTSAGSYGTLRSSTPVIPGKFFPNFPWDTNVNVGDPHHRINQPLDDSAAKLNAPIKAVEKSKKKPGRKRASNKLRDISNNVNRYCESPAPLDEHRQQPNAIGPQNTSFSIPTRHTRASCQKCAYDELTKSYNESRTNRQSATQSVFRSMPQSEPTGLRNAYASASNCNHLPGSATMLDGAIRNAGPTMPDAMPPTALAPSHHGNGAENCFRHSTANVTNQAQCQSSAPQAMNTTRYSNKLPDTHYPIHQYRLAPDGSLHLVEYGQRQAPQYRPIPNGQYHQQSYANGVRSPAQQKQFLRPGLFTTMTRMESGNTRNQVPQWRGNPRQGHAASGSNATTTGIPYTVGGSYVITNSNGQYADSSTSYVTMSNPPVSRNILPQPTFEMQSTTGTIGRGEPNWSKPVQTNQRPTQNQPIQYQQSQMPRNLPPTAATNQVPTVQTGTIQFQPNLSHGVPPTTAASNLSPTIPNQPITLQPDLSFSLSMKAPCHRTDAAVNAKTLVREGAPNPTIVLQNCQIINSPTIVSPISGESATKFVMLQRPEAVSANSSSVSRRLAGNALPGDMLMTTRVADLPPSKKKKVKKNQPTILHHFQPVKENLPAGFNSQACDTSVPVAEAALSIADEPNASISQNITENLEPFVRLTTPSTSFSSAPAPTQLRVRNKPSLFSVTKITSAESTQTSTLSDHPPRSLQSASSEDGENMVMDALHEAANTLVKQSTPVIEKRTVTSQTSNDTSTSQSILKQIPEQTMSLNYDKRVGSPTPENQNNDDSYGYDYKTLAKALQSKQSKTVVTSVVQVETEPNGLESTKDACHDDKSQHERRLLPPSSPSTSEEVEHGANDFGYDYNLMVKARQRPERKESQSKPTETNILTTPVKLQNTNQPFDSPVSSSPSGFGNRKRVIPPISSDTDSDVESDFSDRYRRKDHSKIGKHKKKWRRIIEPSDSSDSEDTELKVRVHSPKSSAFDESTSPNVLKRKQDDRSEEPVQRRLKCSISTIEFAYMASCRVILPRIDDVFDSLKILPHGPSDVNENTDSLRSDTVQSNTNLTFGVAQSDLEIPSYRQLNDNITDCAPTSRSDKSENHSVNTNHRNASKRSWLGKQTGFSDTKNLGQSVASDSISDTTDKVSSPAICFEPDDDIIENTILYKTDERWRRNRNNSFETDSTVTTESALLSNQRYLSDAEEIDGLSNIEENESPYHSEEDETALSDRFSNEGDIPNNEVEFHNKKNEKSTKKTKTVTFEDQFLPEKENTLTAEKKKFSTVSNIVFNGRSDLDVGNQPFERIDNQHLSSSDDDDDLTSSYTSSNSGSPVKFNQLNKDCEWPFFGGNESGTDDLSNSSHSRSVKKALFKANDIRHQLNDLVKDRNSLVSIPEVRLTKALKLRNRRTHKSRERRKKKEYLKEIGLLGTNVDLAVIEYKKLQANSSLRPTHKNVVMKTKMPLPLEGCSRTRGSIDVMKHQNRKRRSQNQTLSPNDSSNGELLKGYKDVSC